MAGPLLLLCYHPADEQLKDRLVAHLSVLGRFADIQHWSLGAVAPGDDQDRALADAAARADVALLLLSAAFLASPAIQDEQLPALLARHEQGGLTLVPVILRSCLWQEHPVLRRLVPLPRDGRPLASLEDDGQDQALSDICRAAAALAAERHAAGPAADAPCPFPGLACFEEAEAHLFFGRAAECAEALGCLGAAPSGGRRWLQIEGGSGAGKSSLVRAGLLPAARRGPLRGDGRRLLAGAMRPGPEPVLNLAQALHQALPRSAEGPRLPALEAALQEGDGALRGLLRELVPAGCALLLVVDQLEEVFTLAPAAERARLDGLIARALEDAEGPLYLVTTVRSDWLASFQQLPRLGGLLNRAARHHLGALGPEGLREAITAPARLAGLVYESGLVDRLVEEAAREEAWDPLESTCRHASLSIL